MLHPQRVVRVGAGLVLSLGLVGMAVLPAAGTTFARVVFNGSRSQPVVALTFDDGNDAVQARMIFATLRANHLPATFFPFGRAMTLDPALWRSIASAGYPIGNHTVSHADLVRLSNSMLRAEISGADAMIRQITGRVPMPVLRPPYGAWDGRVAAAAAAAGYPTLMLWDVDPRDWTGIAPATIAQRVLTHARDGSVILLHIGPYHTAAALPSIIAGLALRGFGFVTVPQLLGGDISQARVLSGAQIASLVRAIPAPMRSTAKERGVGSLLARHDLAVMRVAETVPHATAGVGQVPLPALSLDPARTQDLRRTLPLSVQLVLLSTVSILLIFVVATTTYAARRGADGRSKSP